MLPIPYYFSDWPFPSVANELLDCEALFDLHHIEPMQYRHKLTKFSLKLAYQCKTAAHEICSFHLLGLAWSLEIQITLNISLQPSIRFEGVRVLAESFGISFYVSAGAPGSLRPYDSQWLACGTVRWVRLHQD